MSGRPWTEAEEALLANSLPYHSLSWIACRLRRTVKACRRYQERHGFYPTNQDLVTSDWASRLTGLAARHLTEAAKCGRIPARRVPGGRRWLFDPETLPGHELPLRKRLDRAC